MCACAIKSSSIYLERDTEYESQNIENHRARVDCPLSSVGVVDRSGSYRTVADRIGLGGVVSGLIGSERVGRASALLHGDPIRKNLQPSVIVRKQNYHTS